MISPFPPLYPPSLPLFSFPFLVLEIEPRTFCMCNKHSTTEPKPTSVVLILCYLFPFYPFRSLPIIYNYDFA